MIESFHASNERNFRTRERRNIKKIPGIKFVSIQSDKHRQNAQWQTTGANEGRNERPMLFDRLSAFYAIFVSAC